MVIKSGKYLGLAVRNVRLVGQATVRVDIYYQTSSAGVNNADGVNIYLTCGTGYKYKTKLIIPYNANSERLIGSYDLLIDNTDSWFYVTAYCEDSVSPSGYPAFSTTSDAVLGYKGSYTYVGITGATGTTCTVKSNVRNMYSEEMTYKNYSGVYETQNLNATSSDGSNQTITYTMTGIPANTKFTENAGTVPPGGNGSSPWAWLNRSGQGTITYATTFTNMSMPTLSISRNGTTVTVSWTAGGTTNKPNGLASRSGKILLRDINKATLQSVSANLEVAGSTTFTVASDIKVYAVGEYTVTGLVDSNGTAKTYYQYSNEPYLEGATATGYVKVNGVYKKSLETYVKVNGVYKKVLEGYIKVNGVYKKII